MKFRAERSEFADAAAWSLRTVGARAESTDLELSSPLVLPVQAGAEGTALVPGRLLGDVVRRLPQAAIEAEVDQDSVPAGSVEPPPVQKPHPPMLIGGDDAAAIDRTVAGGSGVVGGDVGFDDVEWIVCGIRDRAEQAGYEPGDLELVAR